MTPSEELPGGDEAVLRLLGAVFRRARFEAERGDQGARDFLAMLQDECEDVAVAKGIIRASSFPTVGNDEESSVEFDTGATKRQAA